MKKFLIQTAKTISEKVYSSLGKNSGNMLLTTSILGLTLSAGAQIIGICLNDKYTTRQKAFMIPQELGELFVSSIAIFAITKPTQRLAAKLIRTGKILPKELVGYLKENNLLEKRGQLSFDFEREVNNIVNNIKNSDVFLKSDKVSQELLIQPHKDVLDKYGITKDAVSAYATTGASFATVGCAVPVLRNRFAAYYQKKNIEIYNMYSNPLSNNNNKI